MQKMKVFFINVNMKNEKKRYFLQIKRAHVKAKIRESVLPHFFKPYLIIMHHPIQYRNSLGRYLEIINMLLQRFAVFS